MALRYPATREVRAQRAMERQHVEHYKLLVQALGHAGYYVPAMPTAEESAEGTDPYRPPITPADLIAAVKAHNRTRILAYIQENYAFLDALRTACQQEGWDAETREQPHGG